MPLPNPDESDAQIAEEAHQLALLVRKSMQMLGLEDSSAGELVLDLLEGRASAIQQMKAGFVINKLSEDLALTRADQELARGLVLLISRPEEEKKAN